MSKHGELPELAAAVLQPGFVGTTAPDWIRRRLAEGLGGVALFARNVESPAQVAALTAQLRAERPDVIVAIDEEAGDVTRFESRDGSSRPGNLALGAIDDPLLTEAVARDLGCELAAAGITLDYAPDADVNNNPDNPVIGVRAFGAEPHLVARHAAAFVRGLQTYGVAACAKHFPGHGDTAVDSHHDVPLIDRTAEELAANELVPFRAAIAAGAKVVMTGHLLVPAYDNDLPATLSPRILTGLLRDELGFDGLIVTDGIEMQGVRRRFGLAGATVRALAAGVDAICVGGDHADEETALHLRDAIVAAVLSGELPEARLRDAVARVRALGAWTTRTQKEAGVVRGPQPASEIGFNAARRAVRVTRAESGPELPVAGVPHVVEFAPPRNIAIGEETPWGIGAPLAALLPGTTAIRLSADDHPTSTLSLTALLPTSGLSNGSLSNGHSSADGLSADGLSGGGLPADGLPADGLAVDGLSNGDLSADGLSNRGLSAGDLSADGLAGPADAASLVLAGAAGRPLILVVRDVHRHRWIADILDVVLETRPDAIVVEMGIPVKVLGGVHVATFGATRACGQAAAELIAGANIPEPVAA